MPPVSSPRRLPGLVTLADMASSERANEVVLPALQRAASRSSQAAQRRYLQLTGAQLVLLALGSLLSVLVWQRGDINVAALLAAVAIVFAGVFRVQARLSQPTRTWYHGRAAAESAKTLAWRYAVGGDPFPVELTEAEADHRFADRLTEILIDLDNHSLEIGEEDEEITGWMRSTRALALGDRRATYSQGRIAQQRSWYRDKAAWNSRRANLLGLITLLFEAVAVIQALAKATGLINVNLIAFIATITAGIVAWMHTRDFHTLASAYTVASRELAAISSLIKHQETEEDWAAFVNNAEDSISREHTLWRASRT